MNVIYYIMFLTVALVGAVMLLMLSKEQVKLKLRAVMKRKKNYMLVHRMGEDQKMHTYVAPINDKIVNVGGYRFHIEKQHVYFDPHYNLQAVVVSDETVKSIDPRKDSSQQSALSPQTVDESVLAAVMGPEYQMIVTWLKVNTIMAAFSIMVALGMLVFAWALFNGAQEAGIQLAMG